MGAPVLRNEHITCYSKRATTCLKNSSHKQYRYAKHEISVCMKYKCLPLYKKYLWQVILRFVVLPLCAVSLLFMYTPCHCLFSHTVNMIDKFLSFVNTSLSKQYIKQ